VSAVILSLLEFILSHSKHRIRDKFPRRPDAVSLAGNEPLGLVWGNRLILSLNKNLDFGAPAFSIQPGGKQELLFLVKKLGLHLVPLFLKFLGIRLPAGLKGQQVVMVLEPLGLFGKGVLPGKLKRGAGYGFGLPLSQKTLEPGKKAAVLAGQTGGGGYLAPGFALSEFPQQPGGPVLPASGPDFSSTPPLPGP
jgi:hypothetical protein